MNKIYLYVDDERTDVFRAPLDYTLFVARSYNEAIAVLSQVSYDYCFIDLDHDLGIGKTGYDICKFIIENVSIDKLEYRLHTMNPVGRQNMEQLLSHYGYSRY